MLRIVAASLVVLAGCESCSWTWGDIPVGGVVTVIGHAPADLSVRACGGPDPDRDDCAVAQVLPPPSDGVIRYWTSLPDEGVITCGFPKRWLVFTGTGCETVAFGTITHDDVHAAGAEAAMTDLSYDATIDCGPK